MQHVPEEITSTLVKLQDQDSSARYEGRAIDGRRRSPARSDGVQAQPRPFASIDTVLKEDFGRSAKDLFADFEEQPIAAASLAQVHRATLKDGSKVAVKVQYPRLQHQFETDIATMATLSKAVAWLFPGYQFEWLVPEFSKNLSKELDFVQEAGNVERTARVFASKEELRMPMIYRDMSTKRVLTMEFMEGCRIDNVASLREQGLDLTQIADVLVEVFAEMIFCHGFVHSDPHPGNILVQPCVAARGPRKFRLGVEQLIRRHAAVKLTCSK
eukprot:SM000033S12332  [mRNA]  locus=s33:244821:247672:+ [translate_table: standard]